MATFCLIFFPASFSIMFYEESKGRSLFLHFPCQMIIGFVSSLLTNFSAVICMLLFNKCKNASRRENRIDKGIQLGNDKVELLSHYDTDILHA